jgi:hypothetical protein
MAKRKDGEGGNIARKMASLMDRTLEDFPKSLPRIGILFHLFFA